MTSQRQRVAAAIAVSYPVTVAVVAELLERLDDNETLVRRCLDANICPGAVDWARRHFSAK